MRTSEFVCVSCNQLIEGRRPHGVGERIERVHGGAERLLRCVVRIGVKRLERLERLEHLERLEKVHEERVDFQGMHGAHELRFFRLVLRIVVVAVGNGGDNDRRNGRSGSFIVWSRRALWIGLGVQGRRVRHIRRGGVSGGRKFGSDGGRKFRTGGRQFDLFGFLLLHQWLHVRSFLLCVGRFRLGRQFGKFLFVSVYFIVC